MVSKETIPQIVESIRTQINTHSPHPERVSIVAVTKGQPLERIKSAIDCGIRSLANNYAQEGELMMKQLPGLEIDWRFIGHIQSRKVRYLTRYTTVESVDRLIVAEAIAKKAADENKVQSILVQVNIGDESQKSGISAGELTGFLTAAQRFPSLEIKGLMCMPPAVAPIEDRRVFFTMMKALFDEHFSIEKGHQLSMGTSEDYPLALEEGATHIRLGTVLFGARSYR